MKLKSCHVSLYAFSCDAVNRARYAYESKYDNTKRVAETIVEGMQRGGGIEIALNEVKNADSNAIPTYDAIVIGGPTYFGGPTRGIKKFVNKKAPFH